MYFSKEKRGRKIFEKGKLKPTVLVLVSSAVHNVELYADSKEKSIYVYLNENRKEMLCQLHRS